MNFSIKQLGLAAFLASMMGSGAIAPAFANAPKVTSFGNASFQLAQSSWQRFSPPEASITVLMPGTPERTVRGEQYQYIAEAADGVYLINFQRIPGNPDISQLRAADLNRAFDRGIERFISGAKAQLVSQRQISLAGNPGREFTFQLSGIRGKGRIFLIGPQIYLLIGISEQSADTDRFLNSFQLQ